MAMKTIKVTEATKLQLDWLVADCEGHGDRWLSRWREGGDKRFTYCEVVYSYTERSEQMWPIMEREKIVVLDWDHISGLYTAETMKPYSPCAQGRGKTQLIAAARCYVASKLGETVEVPEELI